MTDWHEEYRRRYKLAKEQGRPFFPQAVFKDVLVWLLLLGVLAFLAHKLGAPLDELADPTDTTYNPRPEWYFLFLFQALKAFPGRLEALAAVFLPGAAVLLLFCLPFLDRGPKRHPWNRPFWSALGVFALAGFTYLTVAGYRSPLVNPVVARDPRVARGLRLYQSLNCAYCHRISRQGGTTGPALDRAGGEKSEEWLKRHFQDPRSVSPGSTMPKLDLLDDEIDALTAYVLSVAGAYTKEAPKLVAENCAACHRIGKKGAQVGPDLSSIGSARDRAYLKRYVSDPVLVNPKSQMPGFKGQLSDVQLEDVARYLSSLQSKG